MFVKKLKRPLILILAGLLLFSFMMAGCGQGKNVDLGSSDSKQAQTQEKASDTKASTSTEPQKPANPFEPSAAKIDWQQFKGTNLRVVFDQHMFTEVLKPQVADFEKLTGMKVTFETYPENEFRNKLMVEFTGGANAPDVFMVDQTELSKYLAGGWIEPVDGYVGNSKITDTNWYDYKDLQGVGSFGANNGKQYGIPITGEWQILFYRKDLYEAKGLKVPKTMDELYANAKALTTNDVAGFAGRFSRTSASWYPWAGFVGVYGGYWVDPKSGKSQLESDAAKQASNMYVKLAKDCGPKGILNYTWYEATSDFQQGRTAHLLDASVFESLFEDPKNSKVAGKVGYATLPLGKDGADPKCVTSYWMLGMGSQSKNKEAAWMFLQWATSKQMGLKVGTEKGTVVRKSLWSNEEFLNKVPKEYAEASAKSAPAGDISLYPMIKELGEVGEYVSIALDEAYAGQKTVDQALKDAQAKTEKALSKK